MSFKSYRAIDIFILTTVMIVGELLASFAANKWFKLNSLGISIMLPILLLISMRWGWLVVIPALVGGFASSLFAAISGGVETLSTGFVVINVLGSLVSVLACLWFKFVGRKRTKDSWIITLAFAITMFLLQCIVRGVVNFIFVGEKLFQYIIYYVTRDSITLLFTIVVLLIVRKLEGVFEYQKTYLLELEKKKQEEKLKQNMINS